MTCNDCGNNETFIIGYMCYDKVFFDRGGNEMDSKGLSCEDVGIKPRCYECESDNVRAWSA